MSGREYWRSLEERADSPEFREFLEQEVAGNPSQWLGPSTRREFFKLMGASLAMAGLQSCSLPEEKILPFANPPEGRMPGVPQFFATSMDFMGAARGLLVKSFDGRPVKIEGNPLDPVGRGGTDAFAQAAILELYDPDRSRKPIRRDGRQSFPSDWAAFDDWARGLFGAHRVRGGAGLFILSEASSSPTLDRLKRRMGAELPQARWFEYEPVSRDNAREGARAAFGAPLRVLPMISEARVIASFDEDFLGGHPAGLGLARDFAEGRRGEQGVMNRLHVVEAAYTLTGAAADHRYPLAPSRIPAALAATILEVFDRRPNPLITPALRQALAALAEAEGAREIARSVAADLLQHPGQGMALVGPRQAPAVHALGHLLNSMLGNLGRTVVLIPDPDGDRPTHLGAIRTLAETLDGGAVETLVILGGNPAYDAPRDLSFGERMGKAAQSVHLSLHENETSALATWHLPRAHFLEAWGDGRAWDGTVLMQQPLIDPLFGGRSAIEVVAAILGDLEPKGHDLVRETLQAADQVDIEKAWRHALHDGLVAGTAHAAVAGEVSPEPLSSALQALPRGETGVELVFAPDPSTWDGRFANNGWLQELPDPLSKITWDNCAWVGPTTAASLGLENERLMTIERDGRTLEIVCYVMPGQAPGTITLPLGYGRTNAGRVGNGVGFDTYALRTTGSFEGAGGAQVRNLGRKYKLSWTQHFHMIDRVGFQERQHRIEVLVREAEYAEYAKDPKVVEEMGPHYEPAPLWKEFAYDGHKWGLAIDLNACIGCGACVMACNAENNLPIVGKDQVRRGRLMHWIRVDRYFRGGEENPGVSYQPVTCQQCENAPCEQVCPVAATMHNEEGLNDQVYNRCIGTRYCSNNCPYKVRRFNYFNYQKHLTPLEKMHFNPEVTVRSRGVMEKCTYCVQRINAVKIAAKNDARAIADGEIETACAGACPTRAITFGDLNDPKSRIRERHDHPRAYGMLAELHVRPRTKYLARLRNPAGEGGVAGNGHEG